MKIPGPGAKLAAAVRALRGVLGRPAAGAVLDQIAARYRVLTDNLVASVIVRDVGGATTYCSPYTEVLTGYPLSELVAGGADVFGRLVHEEDRDSYERSLKVGDGGDPFQCRFRFYHRSGLEVWAESRSSPVADPTGEIRAVLSVVFDVTAAVRARQAVEERNRDLQDFAYMISHDLKAPLFTMKGMTALLRSEFAGRLGEEGREILDHMERAVRRQEKLVQGVLEYSRISSERPPAEAVDLDKVVREAAAETGPLAAAAGGSIEVRGELPAVTGDELSFGQVFANLLGNAVKYRHPDRPPRVTVTETPCPRRRFVRIEVADNGTGIPAEKLDLVFRPFHRAHGPEIEGSGVGLAAVKKLVERAGGTVALRSEAGEGSVFAVDLLRA